MVVFILIELKLGILKGGGHYIFLPHESGEITSSSVDVKNQEAKQAAT